MHIEAPRLVEDTDTSGGMKICLYEPKGKEVER